MIRLWCFFLFCLALVACGNGLPVPMAPIPAEFIDSCAHAAKTCNSPQIADRERLACFDSEHAPRSCAAMRETTVGVEYAGSAFRGKPLTHWTCETIMAFRYFLPSGLLSEVEILRAVVNGGPKEATHMLAVGALVDAEQAFAKSHGITTDDFSPETKYLTHSNGVRATNGHTHRCWLRDGLSHPDARSWPAATWPRPTTQLAGLPGKVPAALAWDPSQSNTPGSGYYCAGVIWARTRVDSDLSTIWPRWIHVRDVPAANKTDADSMARSRLLEMGRSKAYAEHGTMMLTFDVSQDVPSSEAIVCWKASDKPPTEAPMGWPERINPWANWTSPSALMQYSPWSADVPPPTQRNP